jgi:hypothetical protein
MKTRDFEKNGVMLARYIPGSAWAEGLLFFSKDEEFVQVGTWNYPKGKVLQAHIHNIVPRTINRTQEVIFVRKGSIEATIYDLDGVFVTKLNVIAGDVLILLSCGHGYIVTEDETEVLEVKNGPYMGAEIDRTRITS